MCSLCTVSELQEVLAIGHLQLWLTCVIRCFDSGCSQVANGASKSRAKSIQLSTWLCTTASRVVNKLSSKAAGVRQRK